MCGSACKIKIQQAFLKCVHIFFQENIEKTWKIGEIIEIKLMPLKMLRCEKSFSRFDIYEVDLHVPYYGKIIQNSEHPTYMLTVP